MNGPERGVIRDNGRGILRRLDTIDSNLRSFRRAFLMRGSPLSEVLSVTAAREGQNCGMTREDFVRTVARAWDLVQMLCILGENIESPDDEVEIREKKK